VQTGGPPTQQQNWTPSVHSVTLSVQRVAAAPEMAAHASSSAHIARGLSVFCNDKYISLADAVWYQS